MSNISIKPNLNNNYQRRNTNPINFKGRNIKPKQVNSVVDSLTIYLSEIKKYKRLSPEEVKQLFEVVSKGGNEAENARQKIINGHLGYVVYFAKKYKIKRENFMDLIEAGNFALIKAVDSYIKSENVNSFSTYVAGRIKRNMHVEAYKQNHIIDIPVKYLEKLNRIKKAIEEFEQDNFRSPTLDELSKQLQISVEKLQKILMLTQYPLSLDAPTKINPQKTLLNFIAQKSNEKPEIFPSPYINKIKKQDIFKAINRLKPQYKETIVSYFGFIAQKAIKQTQIAKRTNMTRSNVGEIIQQACAQLKLIFEGKADRPLNNFEKLLSKLGINLQKSGDKFLKPKILTALEKLPEEDRMLIILRFAPNDTKPVSQEKIAQEFGITRAKLQVKEQKAVLKLKQVLEKGYFEDETPLAKLFAALNFENKTNPPEFSEETILSAIEKLNEKEKIFLEFRFGLDGKKEHSMRELQEKFNLTEGNAKGLQKRILDKLSANLCGNKIPETPLEKLFAKMDFSSDRNKPEFIEAGLIEALGKLPQNEKEFLIRHFGINCEKLSIKQVAKMFNLSNGSACRFEDKAIKDLKEIILQN